MLPFSPLTAEGKDVPQHSLHTTNLQHDLKTIRVQQEPREDAVVLRAGVEPVPVLPNLQPHLVPHPQLEDGQEGGLVDVLPVEGVPGLGHPPAAGHEAEARGAAAHGDVVGEDVGAGHAAVELARGGVVIVALVEPHAVKPDGHVGRREGPGQAGAEGRARGLGHVPAGALGPAGAFPARGAAAALGARVALGPAGARRAHGAQVPFVTLAALLALLSLFASRPPAALSARVPFAALFPLGAPFPSVSLGPSAPWLPTVSLFPRVPLFPLVSLFPARSRLSRIPPVPFVSFGPVVTGVPFSSLLSLQSREAVAALIAFGSSFTWGEKED